LKSTRILVFLLSVVSAHAGAILSENFNELPAQLGVTSAGALTAINGTNIDVVGAADGFGSLCVVPEVGNCVDLDGTGGNSQGVLASGFIMLEPGTDYYLSYDLIGSNRGLTTSATVTFGSYSKTYSLASGDVTSGIVNNALITVSAPTQTELVFTSNTPGNIGSVLDNVVITSVPAISSVGVSASPEPCSLMLLMSALMGWAWLKRRRLVPVRSGGARRPTP
jgi:hypothetical protein